MKENPRGLIFFIKQGFMAKKPFFLRLLLHYRLTLPLFQFFHPQHSTPPTSQHRNLAPDLKWAMVFFFSFLL